MGSGPIPGVDYGQGWQETPAHGSSVFGMVETPPWGSSVFGGHHTSESSSSHVGSYGPAGVSDAQPTRGGHPEHHEAGGAWGAPVRDSRAAAPGPRQEYLDAFEALGDPEARDDVFAAGAPQRGASVRRGTGAGRPGGPYAASGGPYAAGQAPSADLEDGRADPYGGADEEPDAPLAAVPATEEPRRKGRTLTGAAAAAVTTVLAVVVAGQVTGMEGEHKRAGSAGEERDSEADSASRSDSRPDPSAGPSEPAKASYAEKMATVVPLSRNLHGPGTFTTVGGQQDGAAGADEVVRYRVDVEKDLPLDTDVFVKAVHTTLNDDRSWSHGGARSFERVTSGQPDFVITLASPGTTGEWCAKSGLDTTEQTVSCDSAATSRIMINAYRWAQGSKTFGDELIRKYREMLINHEVGHRLGRDHEYCEGEGAQAPVMMQQTKTLTTNGVTCRPNAWPYPRS